jgi:hypothetical protein
MKNLATPPPDEDSSRDPNAPAHNSPEEGAQPIPGDRGVPLINRARSIQSRVSNVLAAGLLGALALGILTWYYANTLTRPGQRQCARAPDSAACAGD